jgi:hypothetical protein
VGPLTKMDTERFTTTTVIATASSRSDFSFARRRVCRVLGLGTLRLGRPT